MKSQDIKFYLSFITTGGYFFIELIFGILTNSLALKADAFHMLSDVIAISIGFITSKISQKPRNTHSTYGWIRSELLGGLINSVFLLSSCLTIFIELIQRLFYIDEVKETMDKEVDKLLVVAIIGLIVNIFNFIIFNLNCFKVSQHAGHGHSHNGSSHSINIKAMILHILGDILGSVGVIITALLIKFVDSDNIYYVDPICSFFIICIILVGTIPVLKKCMMVLLQNSSKKVDIKLIEKEILALDTVIDIHEFHVWRLDINKNIASIHVFIDNLVSVEDSIFNIKNILHNHNIHSTTIQPEFEPKCNEPKCNKECLENRCCDINESLIDNIKTKDSKDLDVVMLDESSDAII